MFMKPKDVQAGLGAVIAQLEANAAHLGELANTYEAQAEVQAQIVRDASQESYRLSALADQKRSEGIAALAQAKKLYEVKDA